MKWIEVLHKTRSGKTTMYSCFYDDVMAEKLKEFKRKRHKIIHCIEIYADNQTFKASKR
jgi:hypothetical protein